MAGLALWSWLHVHAQVSVVPAQPSGWRYSAAVVVWEW